MSYIFSQIKGEKPRIQITMACGCTRKFKIIEPLANTPDKLKKYHDAVARLTCQECKRSSPIKLSSRSE